MPRPVAVHQVHPEMRRRRRGEQQDNHRHHGDAHARPHRRRRTCPSPPLAPVLSVLYPVLVIYILEPPDATHGDAVGRYVRMNACLYLLLPTRLAIHSCMTLPKSGRQPGAIDTHKNL